VEVEGFKNWKALSAKYELKRKPLGINFKKEVISLYGHSESTYTHYLHSYPGKVFPYIPRFFLSINELCPPDGIVIDPFCGSGTVLLESITHPVYKRKAMGIEVNPLARLIAKVKTTPLEIEPLRKRSIALIEKLNISKEPTSVIPTFKNINFWFSEKNIKRLLILREIIYEEPDDDIKDFFYVCFSSIIRKFSNADPLIPPPVKLKMEKYSNSPQKNDYLKRFLEQVNIANTVEVFEEKVRAGIRAIEALNLEIQPCSENVDAKIIWDDARSMKKATMSFKSRLIQDITRPLESKSMNLILTSPPYLTAQKYVRTVKLETSWLELLSDKDLINLSRDIIGSECSVSTNTKAEEKVGVEEIDSLIEWSSKISKERSIQLFKYFSDMKCVFNEIHRVLRDDGSVIIVVGNNNVLSKSVKTYELLVKLGNITGFQTKVILKDKIRGRGMITKRHNNGGLIKEEYSLVMAKN
jgi:DNA modification methylase